MKKLNLFKYLNVVVSYIFMFYIGAIFLRKWLPGCIERFGDDFGAYAVALAISCFVAFICLLAIIVIQTIIANIIEHRFGWRAFKSKTKTVQITNDVSIDIPESSSYEIDDEGKIHITIN